MDAGRLDSGGHVEGDNSQQIAVEARWRPWPVDRSVDRTTDGRDHGAGMASTPSTAAAEDYQDTPPPPGRQIVWDLPQSSPASATAAAVSTAPGTIAKVGHK